MSHFANSDGKPRIRSFFLDEAVDSHNKRSRGDSSNSYNDSNEEYIDEENNDDDKDSSSCDDSDDDGHDNDEGKGNNEHDSSEVKASHSKGSRSNRCNKQAAKHRSKGMKQTTIDECRPYYVVNNNEPNQHQNLPVLGTVDVPVESSEEVAPSNGFSSDTSLVPSSIQQGSNKFVKQSSRKRLYHRACSRDFEEWQYVR